MSPAAGVCQCPSGPGYMSVPIRASLSVSSHQGRVICQCPSGPTYLSVPIRTRLLCQCPAGPGYYVSAQQGQVIMSVPSRAMLLCQCPAGPGISAQQGKQRGWCGIPQGNSIHGCSKRPTPVDQ